MVSTDGSHRERLRRLLNQRFTLDEIQGIAFDLGIPDGERRTHSQLVLYMLIHLERRNRLDELVAWIGRHRRDLVGDLPTIAARKARHEGARSFHTLQRGLARLARLAAIGLLIAVVNLAGLLLYQGNTRVGLSNLPPVETLRAAAYLPGLVEPTATPTPSATPTATASPAATASATPTSTVSATPTPSLTDTPTPTPTDTATPRPTRTSKPTRTPTDTPAPTDEPSPP